MPTPLIRPGIGAVALGLLLSACATDRQPDAAATSCAECGEIVDIRPVGRASLGGSPAVEDARNRVLNPDPALASTLSRSVSGSQRLDLQLADVPVYRMRDSGLSGSVGEVTLQMDHGGMERLLVEDAHTLAVGERVRRVGNRLLPALSPGPDAR